MPTWPGYAKPGFGAPSGTAPAGSGFYFSINDKDKKSSYVITAAHVIQKSKIIEIKNYKGKLEKVNLISIDKKRDIAIEFTPQTPSLWPRPDTPISRSAKHC